MIVNVTPDPKDTFASIGYNDVTAGGFLNQFSEDLKLSKRILDEWNSTGSSSVDINKWKNDTVYFPAVDLTMKPTGMKFNFKEWKKLQVVPSLDFTGRTSAYSLFYKCSSLKFVGNLTGTESVTNMDHMFANCSSLTSIPQMDTSKVTDMRGMFSYCSSLTSVPQMDTSKVTNMYFMFNNCSSLTSVPQMDTSKVTNMDSMFYSCSSLTSVPQMDTSKVTNMNAMFSYCSSLTSVPQMDTSSATDMYSMFDGCRSLTSIPQMDTSKVTNMGYMFAGCYSLTSIPLLDGSSITRTTGPFGFFSLDQLTDLGGFKDLKVSWSNNFLGMVPNATVASLMNVINNLYDFTSNGETPSSSQGRIGFGTTNLNKLTDEQKAVVINKGWTLT